MGVYSRNDLVAFAPQHDSFVGIDSDGCVFDSMAVKQKQFFHPLIIEYWGLESIEPQLRAVAEFVNLYSRWRGQNRFPALLKVFDLLHGWDEVVASGVRLPDRGALRRYIDSGLPLGNPSLVSYAAMHPEDRELQRLKEWSLRINVEIDARMPANPPFAHVRECLARLQERSDAIVVSQTPEEALVKEWREQALDGVVRLIAGQELGTKREHLELAAVGRYPKERILLIGDAVGDMRAAAAADVLFYPINPGHEVASWEQFRVDGYDRFLTGRFAGRYQQELIDTFDALLPERAPWEKE